MPHRSTLDLRATLLAPLILGVGCAQLAVPPAEPPVGVASSAEPEGGVLRGQSPVVAPWGMAYLAPGEEDCSAPPYVYDAFPGQTGLLVPPPGSVFVQPPPSAAPPVGAQPGWFDVLPAEGGAISPDFGLPTAAEVTNRIPNPLYVPSNNPDAAWELIAQTLTEYFPIQSEQRVRRSGAVLTEGRLETPWQTGATVFEPWRNDSVGSFNRWQSTLQTLRRRATVRVIPAAGGYELGVRVEKQLEDLNRPEQASAGAASLRNDASLPTDRLNPIDTVLGSGSWIDIGRDEPLEQEMLGRFAERFGPAR